MPELVTAADIRRAAATLDGVIVRTPLLDAHWLAGHGNAPVRFKCENLQRAGAFKIRGAYNALASLPADVRRRGVVAYSSGNHAQGVALAARLLGMPATVVMPTTAPAVKVEGARAAGAQIVIEGTTSLERQRRAEAIAAERGLTVIPAFDDARIVAGQGTVAVELLEQWPDVETVVVPIGGGGLISGVAAWLRAERPGCRIIGVEPENADAMAQSLAAGAPVTIEAAPTVADGLAPVRPGDLTYAHVAAQVDDVVRMPDDAIMAATALMLQRARLVVEFSGAATLAALLAGRVELRGRRTALIVSGGNLDPRRAADLLATAAPQMA